MDDLEELKRDLKTALGVGWLYADDRGAWCNYCEEEAKHYTELPLFS